MRLFPIYLYIMHECPKYTYTAQGEKEKRGQDEANTKLTWNSLVKISNSKTEM